MGFFHRCIVFLFFGHLSISKCAQNYGGTSLLDFIGVPADSIRPAIYTFIDLERSNISLDQDYILTWAEAWASAGWDPRALTETDASKHPKYQSLLDKLSFSGVPEKNWDRFLRYPAMSMLEDGGYFSNSHVFPLNHATHFFGKGFRLPNEGKFTMHNGLPLSLLSGNKDEWNRILSAIIDGEDNDGDDHIKRDALVLSSMNKENPKDTIIEDSFVDVEFILGLNERNILDGKFCNIVHNKIATRLVTGIHSVGFNTHHDFLKGLQSSLSKCKPTMHTFFELAYAKNVEKSLLIDLEEWKKAWESAGWSTVVLTLDDAKRHPLYEDFRLAFMRAGYQTENYDQMCFFRWLAMASTPNGGWMSDYDTYPLNLYQTYESGFNLPNNGAFTSNLHFVPNLVSGSKTEWNRMVELLFVNYKNHTSEFWSDMLALNDILKEQPSAYKFTYDAIELSTIYSNPPSNIRYSQAEHADFFYDEIAARDHPFDLKRFCHMTEGKLAVHFSHASCKKTGFCRYNRGPLLNNWLDTWRQICLFDA